VQESVCRRVCRHTHVVADFVISPGKKECCFTRRVEGAGTLESDASLDFPGLFCAQCHWCIGDFQVVREQLRVQIQKDLSGHAVRGECTRMGS
jgi:hypothetical protein